MMRLPCVLVVTWLFVACSFAMTGPKQHKIPYRQQDLPPDLEQSRQGKIRPKVFVVNMFEDEEEPWIKRLPSDELGDLLSNIIPVPGLSPKHPDVRCNQDKSVCQMTTGEGEINAAASMSALTLSEQFDLRGTYFVLAGIAGVNPKLGTLGSVAVARFAVQVALQYELDARELPAGFATGYVAFGTKAPGRYPTSLYGTEVMGLNAALAAAAFAYANASARLVDGPGPAAYRALYAASARAGDGGDGDGDDDNDNDKAPLYRAATDAPSLLRCDVATSDVYYSGARLGEAFENTTRLWTNQSALTYCMTAQEDNAILQSLLRATLAGKANYSRAVVLRSGSNFDRPPPGVAAAAHLLVNDQDGLGIAVANQYLAGVEVVRGFLADWDELWRDGIPATGYFGDILGSLGGTPDFGPGSIFNRTNSADQRP